MVEATRRTIWTGNAPESILVYRLGSIGDTVVALPALHLIRQKFPEAHFVLLTNNATTTKAAPLETVLGAGRFFDEVLAFPTGTRDLRILLRLAGEIRRRRIKTVVHLAAARGRRASFRDWIFFTAAGASRIVGVPFRHEDLHVIKLPGEELYEPEAKRLVRRLKMIGKIDLEDDAAWDLCLGDEERRAAQDHIAATLSFSPFLAASVGTKMHAKDWEATNWEALIQRLGKRLPGWGLLLIGATEDFERSEKCLAHWCGPRLNLCGQLTPRISAAAVGQAAAFLGHDSGPMHLAAAMGVPCIAVFAARNLPGHWYPRGRGNRVLYHQTNCFGCGLEVCEVERKRCILSITVDEVEEAALAVLAQAGAIASGSR